MRRLRWLFVLLLPSFFIVGRAAEREPVVPTPEAFFGFSMGAEGQLADWSQIVEYFKTVDAASNRVLVQELGKTTNGLPYIVSVISTPDTIANLAGHQRVQRKLANPRTTPPEEAARLARDGKVVVLVATSVHSNEIGNSQMVNRLLYTLATSREPEIQRILDRVILVLVPCQNPDGQQMVVDWYRANKDTPFEDAPLPDLYHKYAGHDTNRDSFMLALVETRYLNTLTYRDWLPEVVLDKHQMGSNRARIFVPPFKNPPNPNIDPLVWSEVNQLGQAMATKLHETDKSGVIWDDTYSGFWQGAISTNPWWHNMVALLTETASAGLARTLVQLEANPDAFRPPPTARPRAVLPPPSDTQPRMNYPRPWMGGSWSPADVVDYEYLSTMGLLEAAANNRGQLKRNFYAMNRRTIERFSAGKPYAYVIPPGQRDPAAAARLLALVAAGGAEIHRASTAFSADGQSYPAGTHVVLLAQSFGRWVKDLLEPQQYPDIRWPDPSGPPDRPYDVTAWTLGFMMGVETVRVDNPFDAPLTRVGTITEPLAPGRVTGEGSTFLLDHGDSNSFIAMARLLERGARIQWTKGATTVEGRSVAEGAIVVTDVAPSAMRTMARDLGLDVTATSARLDADVDLLDVVKPRVAVFEPWGAAMDAGWTRWVLDKFEVPYTDLRPPDVLERDIFRELDVIVVPSMPTWQIVRGYTNGMPAAYRGGIGDLGVRRLRDFAASGGTIVTLGDAADFATEWLGVPIDNRLARFNDNEFFAPGSILRVRIDTSHPVGYGMAPEASAMFVQNGGYRPRVANGTGLTTIASYPETNLLRSGWLIGEPRLQGMDAIVEAQIGRGRVIVESFRVQHRAQTWGTFKLLLNALYYGASPGRPMGARETVQQ